MRVDGRCHCGLITFEAEIDPEQVEICHCTDCQSLSASAFRVVVPAAAENFSMSGEPTVYVKTAESGARRVQTFCPRCGSAIYSTTADERPTSYNIRVGTIRQRNELSPRAQYWTRSAQKWVKDLASLPRVETQ
jgi:hypothetical protein